MFSKDGTECPPFATAKHIIDKNLLFSEEKVNKKYLTDLFEAGEKIATGPSLSNSIKVHYFYLLLKAYSEGQQEQVKTLYKNLIILYREACSPLVNELIAKEIAELKRQNEMMSKLRTLQIESQSNH